MEDIICTIPEACGDKDCKYQWHIAHYWIYGDGTYTVCDTDGNHEPCEEADLPTAEQENQAWLDYYAYVAEHGLDPCNEFVLPTRHKKKRIWQARIRNWIGATQHGLKVSGVRRRGRGAWVSPFDDAPPEVRDFLLIKDNRCCISDYKSFDQMIADKIDVKMQNELEGWLTFEVDEEQAQWNEERIVAWLRKKAKASIIERQSRVQTPA